MKDDTLYDQVAEELKAQAMVPGVWARAFAEAEGQLDRARALYIKYRVTQIAEEKSKQLQAERLKEGKAASRKRNLAFRRLWYFVLACVCGLLTIVFGLGIAIPFTEHSNADVGVAIFMICIAFAFGLATHRCVKAYDNEKQ